MVLAAASIGWLGLQYSFVFFPPESPPPPSPPPPLTNEFICLFCSIPSPPIIALWSLICCWARGSVTRLDQSPTTVSLSFPLLTGCPEMQFISDAYRVPGNAIYFRVLQGAGKCNLFPLPTGRSEMKCISAADRASRNEMHFRSPQGARK
jgi:hypothetical protein